MLSFSSNSDLSPPDFKDAHFVLKLDLRDFDSHSKCVQEVLDKYGQVSVRVGRQHLHRVSL